MTADRYTLTLPWAKPPLTANQRPPWPVRRRLTKEVRGTVAWLAKAAGIVPADTPEFMSKAMPVVLPQPQVAGMWLEVTARAPNTAVVS